jgi:hypothetical protein
MTKDCNIAGRNLINRERQRSAAFHFGEPRNRKGAFTLIGLLVCSLLAGLAVSGCGKKAAPSGPSGSAENRPGTPGYIPPAKSQEFVVNGQIDLPALTAALRNYCRRKMRVPKDLNELVTSKYLTNLPTPPAGQNYAINPDRLEVILVNQ